MNKDKKRDIFISGKITGTNIIETVDKFQTAKFEIIMSIEGIGQYMPVNPLELDGIHFGIEYDEAMKISIERLKECDAIYMLTDWGKSGGAIKELETAKELGFKVFYQKNNNYL